MVQYSIVYSSERFSTHQSNKRVYETNLLVLFYSPGGGIKQMFIEIIGLFSFILMLVRSYIFPFFIIY